MINSKVFLVWWRFSVVDDSQPSENTWVLPLGRLQVSVVCIVVEMVVATGELSLHVAGRA